MHTCEYVEAWVALLLQSMVPFQLKCAPGMGPGLHPGNSVTACCNKPLPPLPSADQPRAYDCYQQPRRKKFRASLHHQVTHQAAALTPSPPRPKLRAVNSCIAQQQQPEGLIIALGGTTQLLPGTMQALRPAGAASGYCCTRCSCQQEGYAMC